ncbi:MAG: thioredoxin domain-containing protein [Chthonomonadales bacterium]|nr:thioredoxin domain-containing protein [Chthonomonadales bacterium]
MLKCQTGAVSKADYAIVALFLCLATGFSAAAIIQHRGSQETRRLAALGRYNARPEEVIGKASHVRGPSDAPYVLVEFGDYECGPCRAMEPRVKALLKKHERNLALVFRDLPLTTIHPRAMHAATLANRAATAADYWAIHDLLYSAKIDSSSLRRATEALAQCTTQPLGEQTAMSRVHESIRVATRLGIGGTPTFALVCPGGIVRRVRTLEDVEELLNAAARACAANDAVGRR